jgi:DNA-binding transcriptional regulator YiaG
MTVIEQLVQEEHEARAVLREAEEAYKAASLEVRKKLGRVFASKREALGFSQLQCAALLGVVRQKVFSVENPEKVANSFGVSTYCEMIQAVDELAKIADQIPKVRRGRMVGGKNRVKTEG